MDELWKVIASITLELHPQTVELMAEDIAATASYDDFCKKLRTLEGRSHRYAIRELKKTWQSFKDVSPEAIAAGLKASAETAGLKEKQESLDLVWTGPNTGLVPCRHTEQVLLEVISSATQRIFLVSFVGFNIPSIQNALNEVAASGVRVCILLESSKQHGGQLDVDSIHEYKDSIPKAKIYAWQHQQSSKSRWNGVVHAKCAVSDGLLAFITSANLSKAAMDRNMELGVMIRGGSIPDRLDKHLTALIKTNIVTLV